MSHSWIQENPELQIPSGESWKTQTNHSRRFYLTMVVTRIGQAPMPASTRLRAYFWPATRHSQAPSTTPASSFGSPPSRLLTAISSAFLARDEPRAPNACSGDRRLLWSGVELGLPVSRNCRVVQLSFSIVVKHYPMK